MSDPRITEDLPGLYDDTRTLSIRGSINHEVAVKLGDEETFFTWADDLLAAATQAVVEANGLPPVHPRHHDHINARDAADCDACNTPASRERPTDALLAAGVFREPPTREQIAEALHTHDQKRALVPRYWANASEMTKHTYLGYADTVLALINGSQANG